jgi:hypothetical protein
MEHTHTQQPCQSGPHPMGFIVPLLVLPVAIGLMRGFAHHHNGLHRQHPSEWKNGVPPMFAEMHRRAHAAETTAEEVHEA